MHEIRRHSAPMALRALSLAFLLVVTSAAPALAAGKPGYPDKVTWSGATWDIKTSRSAVGPGPNVFSKANVSVDASGALHLGITRTTAGTWTCAEIIGPASYGYGTYTFTLESAVNALDPNVVLGLFTWSDKAPYAHREIDIEFARWGTSGGGTNAQYVVQPATTAGHLYRFDQPSVTASSHSFTWRAGRITWESRDGSGGLIASYVYSGADVPKPGDERVRLNLWLFNGAAPTNGAAVEVVVRAFAFTP
jgi:hypothetical protein